MILSKHRIGHSVSGRTYLATDGQTLAGHKDECRQAYGNLHGIKFHEFVPGTELTLSNFSWHWILSATKKEGK